jgi:hypothetical protein
MRVASPDGATRTPRPVCLSHRATQGLCGAHLRAHGGRGGERGGRDAVSGDWWFLAAATPLSLVSPPTTSSLQHVPTSARPATPSARASPLALNKQTRDTEKEAAGMEEHSNTNRVYWLQLILYHRAFLTQAATLSCSSSSRRPPRALPAAPPALAAPGMHPGRTDACRSAPVPAAAPPHLLGKPHGYMRMKLPPAHVDAASHRAEVPIPVALASRSERSAHSLPAREASSARTCEWRQVARSGGWTAGRRGSDVVATSHQPPGATSWVGRSRSHATPSRHHCSVHSRLRSDEYQVCCLQRQARSSPFSTACTLASRTACSLAL